MDQLNVYSWLTLAAIVLGPLLAVFATRLLDSINEKRRRKFELFKNLMQTRGIRLDPVHVASLNIVEIEFYDKPKIRAAFQKYIDHLSSPQPTGDQDEFDKYFNQRSDLFMDLVHEIGVQVGYRFDKRELDRRSYVPKGWNDDQELQRQNALMVSQLLKGQRPLPVSNFLLQSNPYPPAPGAENEK